MDYPFADRDDLVEDLHGHRVADPYRWLEDPDDVRTIEWQAAQDYLAEPYLAALPGRERLRSRITELSRAGSVGVPRWRGDRAFFTRRQPDQEHPVLLVREGDGTERVLVDPIAVDPAGTTTLDSWEPSIEGDRLAYQLSTGGDEESRLHVVAVATGAVLDEPIDRCRYSPIAWLPGGGELFYVRRLSPEQVPAGEEQFHRRVYRHKVGADPATDTEIHGAGLDPTNYYGVDTSDNGRWLLVTAAQGTAPRDDVWLVDLAGDGAVRPVQLGIDARWTGADFHDDNLYVLTDRDAPNGRLVRINPAAPAYESWQDVVPEQADAVLTDTTVLDGPVVVAVHSADATERVSWWDGRSSTRLGQVDGHDTGSIAGVRGRRGTTEVWLGYTDYVTPPSVLHWSLESPERLTTWELAPGAPEVAGLSVSRTEYASADGTSITLFILSTEDTPNAPRPTVLYGYGGFNIALTPSYAAARIAWVEAGGVWAIACLRGGSERGEAWHRAGMREHKQNVFDDFAAAAEHLVETGWTTRDQLGIYGGSNGGLLVGAALTQRPELYRAVVCSAPLLDMVRYEQFGLGRTWNDEYGSADVPAELAWLLGYSPYHRVRPGTDYPAVLFTVFGSDTRVDPVHARKLAAALQYATTGSGPILFRAERDVGHGARSVSRTVGLNVDVLAFLGAQLGLTR
ncbi:MAG TPA: prolyl oligopeptidase family serine peptidase [Mycobacteriales bacterium]|jgi:prolyl oligopeptidase|nr:prolyl oligopeptidase family serine peptidase [Mycobacteriales bacterium]